MESAAPPKIDAVVLGKIQAFIHEKGGAASLGSITAKFEGVKKASLAGHFTLTPIQPDGFAVSLPGMDVGTAVAIVSRAPKAPGRKGGSAKTAVPAPAPGGSALVQDVVAFLRERGGAARHGAVTSRFAGLKKVQLEESFILTPEPEQPGNFIVSLPGVQVVFPFKEASKKQPVEKKPWGRGDGEPSLPPPPPLDAAFVGRIQEYLQANGGAASSGHITNAFEGLKKAQLEQHFVLLKDSRGGGNYIVCLDATVVPRAAALVEAAAAKTSRKREGAERAPRQQ